MKQACSAHLQQWHALQVLQQNAEYDALQWSSAVLKHYDKERSMIASAAEQATRASAERAGIGQWLSGLVLREGKVRCHDAGVLQTICATVETYPSLYIAILVCQA